MAKIQHINFIVDPQALAVGSDDGTNNAESNDPHRNLVGGLGGYAPVRHRNRPGTTTGDPTDPTRTFHFGMAFIAGAGAGAPYPEALMTWSVNSGSMANYTFPAASNSRVLILGTHSTLTTFFQSEEFIAAVLANGAALEVLSLGSVLHVGANTVSGHLTGGIEIPIPYFTFYAVDLSVLGTSYTVVNFVQMFGVDLTGSEFDRLFSLAFTL